MLTDIFTFNKLYYDSAFLNKNVYKETMHK